MLAKSQFIQGVDDENEACLLQPTVRLKNQKIYFKREKIVFYLRKMVKLDEQQKLEQVEFLVKVILREIEEISVADESSYSNKVWFLVDSMSIFFQTSKKSSDKYQRFNY